VEQEEEEEEDDEKGMLVVCDSCQSEVEGQAFCALLHREHWLLCSLFGNLCGSFVLVGIAPETNALVADCKRAMGERFALVDDGKDSAAICKHCLAKHKAHWANIGEPDWLRGWPELYTHWLAHKDDKPENIPVVEVGDVICATRLFPGVYPSGGPKRFALVFNILCRERPHQISKGERLVVAELATLEKISDGEPVVKMDSSAFSTARRTSENAVPEFTVDGLFATQLFETMPSRGVAILGSFTLEVTKVVGKNCLALLG
jgi:hypothetical protein